MKAKMINKMCESNTHFDNLPHVRATFYSFLDFLLLYLEDVRAAVWSCFPAAPVNSPSSTDSAQSVAARAETLLGSSLRELTASPIHHTFTLLSTGPVATQGMMGEKATAVTCLQREEEEQTGEGWAQQARTSSWERYQSDDWSQISPNLKSCQALQSNAPLLTCGAASEERTLHHCTLCFWAKLIKAGFDLQSFYCW